MNSALRDIGARMLRGTGYYSARRRLDARRGRRLLVLMYHDILDDDARGKTLDDASPTSSEFAAHVDAASRHFRLIALSEAIREVHDGGLREDSVAITFDDGYASMHRNALPTLQRHQTPATLFVLTGWVDGMAFWWHRLRSIIAGARLEHIDIEAVARILGTSAASLRHRAGGGRRFRVALAQLAEDSLRDMEDAHRDTAIASLQELLPGDSVDTPAPARALSWGQIQDMSRHRVEFGAHTVSHVNFRYVDAPTVEQEIVRSRDEIARQTGCPVTGFAYPYGKDLEQYHGYHDMLRNNGFQYACTAVPGNNLTTTSTYYLRRVIPPSTRSTALIERALCHAFIRDDSFYDMRPSRSGGKRR